MMPSKVASVECEDDIVIQPYDRSEPPTYVTGENGLPSRYHIPSESGYFPSASDDVESIAVAENVTLYQLHPRFGEKLDAPLASGTLILSDPDGGTAEEVAFVGQCDDIVFYVMADDATTKTSEKEFMLMLPSDCIVVDLSECADEKVVLHIEGLLAARTKFHDETAIEEEEEKEGKPKYPEELPRDPVSKAMFRTSAQVARMIVSMSQKGAEKIDDYGEKKKENITESKDVRVGRASIKIAKATRNVSEKTHSVTTKISDKISDVVGGKVGRTAAIKDGDTETKKKARRLLLASSIAYAEVASGASEGYEIMVKSAKAQAVSVVSLKYGEDAGELARHTAGAAANFGSAALTARRVVNVKAIAKSAGKQMVKETIKSSIKGK